MKFMTKPEAKSKDDKQQIKRPEVTHIRYEPITDERKKKHSPSRMNARERQLWNI